MGVAREKSNRYLQDIRLIRAPKLGSAVAQRTGGCLIPVKAKPRDLERFLHDEVAQQLSGIGLQLDLLRVDMQAGTPEMVSRTVAIQRTLDGVLDGIRRFLSDQHGQPSAVRGGKRMQRSR